MSNVVAVVDRWNAHRLKIEQRAHVHGATIGGGNAQRGVTRVICLRSPPLLNAPASRQISIYEIVRRSLIRHEIGPDITSARALHQLRNKLGRVPKQRDGYGAPFGRVARNPCECVFKVRRLFVDVPCSQPVIDATLLAFDVERTCTGKRGREWLRATHTTKSSGQNPSANETAIKVLAPRFDKRFVGALHDALTADVNPRTGRHLAVHHQAFAIKLVKVLPRGPFWHKV